MVPQRPQRPVTRGSQPPPGKAPTSRQPAVRPPTPPIHTAPTTRMPTEAGRSPTRSVPRHGGAKGSTSRKSNLPLILGGVGGGLLLIIIIAIAAMGGTKKEGAASNKKAAPKVVDVASLENDGMKKCDEGVLAIQRAYNIPDKPGLLRGVALITEGNQMLDKANQMSGHTYDTKKYNETLKMARGKLLELK